MADGISSLDSINWGTSTGGAAGSAETTATLGVDRRDVRVPPDTSHVWGSQLNNVKALGLAMSQHFKGGTRLKCLPQTSNPFGAAESGFYIDSSGEPHFVHNGARTSLNDGAGTGWYNVKNYGATGDGTTNDTVAITAAFTAAPTGSYVYFPPGNYKITDTITISKPFTHVVCAGTYNTRFTFAPTSGKPCFKFDLGVLGPLEGCSFTGGARFYGSGAFQKIALDVVDCSGFVGEDIWVDPHPSSTWVGATSIGIRVRGRELGLFRRIRAFCDLPILIDTDPYITTPVNCDHHRFTDTYLRPTPGGSQACVKINDDVIITNLTFDGTNAWILDKYGLYWVETLTPSVSYNIKLSGIRAEQAADLTGHTFYIDHTRGIYNLHLSDAYNATSNNFALLKGINQATIANIVTTTNDAAKSHLVVDRMTDLFINNCFWQVNTTATLTGMTEMISQPKVFTASTLPPWAWYTDSVTAAGKSTLIQKFTSGDGKFDRTANGTTAIGTGATTTALNLGNTGGVGTLFGSDTTLDFTNVLRLKQSGTNKIVFDGTNFFSATAGATSIGSTTGYMGLVMSRHFGAPTGIAPAIAVGSAAQLGDATRAAVITAGSDSSGTITFTSGAGPSAFVAATLYTVGTITFQAGYGAAPKGIVISPANAACAALATGANGVTFFAEQSSTTTTVFVVKMISSGTPTLAASTAYAFAYHVIQ